ncbi:MAG: MFS transporter [Elusimicrobia bacterium]|nr:MFS transporter [Elusimicrobiota bacterium]
MRRGRDLALLCVGQCLLVAGLALSMPYMALYLNTERGLGMGMVGLLLACTMGATAVGHALGGRLSDRLGRRPVMLAALVLRAGFVWLLSDAVAGGWRIPFVAAVHMAGAFAGNFYFPSAQAWIAERWGRHERVEAYGWLRVAANLGWAVGPAVGGLFMLSSYVVMFRATSLICLAAAAYLAWALAPEPPARPQGDCPDCAAAAPPANGVASWLGVVLASPRGPLDRRFVRLCLWTVALGTVMSQLVDTLSVHAVRYAGLSPSRVGLLFSVNGIMVVALQAPVSRFMRGRRISSALWAGALLYAAGYAAVGAAKGFAGLAGSIAVVTLGEIVVSPGIATLSANLAAPEELGRYTGLSGFSRNVGSALAPLLGGLALEHLSPRWPSAPWLGVAALAAAAAFGFRSLGGSLEPEEDGFRAAMSPALEAA